MSAYAAAKKQHARLNEQELACWIVYGVRGGGGRAMGSGKEFWYELPNHGGIGSFGAKKYIITPRILENEDI